MQPHTLSIFLERTDVATKINYHFLAQNQKSNYSGMKTKQKILKMTGGKNDNAK